MTYEEEVVARAMLKFNLEEARSAAARLPEFEGAAVIRKINELLNQRAPAARKAFWPRAAEDPPEAA